MENVEIEEHGVVRVVKSMSEKGFQLELNGETVDSERVSVTIHLTKDDLRDIQADISKLLKSFSLGG